MSAARIQTANGTGSKYFDHHFQRTVIKILPGEFYTTGEDEVIVTVLGSCVAACLMDPVALVGGMNHFMLPLNRAREEDDLFFSARYGVDAMELLINQLLRSGAQRNRLVAKAFGGGKVMKGMTTDIGEQNITFVRSFLQQENIPLWAEDMGSACPRKVYFFPHTGQVLVKRIDRINNDTIFNRESTYFESVNQETWEGDVELFT